MLLRRLVLPSLTALTLSACGDASLDTLLEQLDAPGNVPTLSKSCVFPARTLINPAVNSAYLFEYEDYNILRLADAGLSCGEALVQPEGVEGECPIPRSTWQADIGLPKTLPYMNTPIAVAKYPARFRGLAVGHNYCSGNMMPLFSESSSLLIKSLGPDCMVAQLTDVPDVPIIGNNEPYERVNLNGSFPIQLCVADKPQFGSAFLFEFAKAQAAKTVPEGGQP